jgi:hypothetical protein
MIVLLEHRAVLKIDAGEVIFIEVVDPVLHETDQGAVDHVPERDGIGTRVLEKLGMSWSAGTFVIVIGL